MMVSCGFDGGARDAYSVCNTEVARMPTTIRLDEDTLARLDAVAASSSSTRSAVIKDAVEQYLEYDAWFRQQVAVGQQASRNGDVVAHDEAKARIRALGVHVD
jgi:predicted transcriptional regulator